MSELIQQMLLNGQELQTGDVDNLGQAALMDDRILAELLRMVPDGASVSKCVLPYGQDSNYAQGTVYTSESADALVYIAPFRAVVGSRTAVGTDALANWRDVRSGVCVGGKGVWSATPPTSLAVSQLITANSSGNARWDLIYAIVAPDASQTAVARAVKSPTSGAVTTPNTVTQLACTVSIGYLTGTAAASPVVPSAPADGAGIYYIPLAYVMVPNGFGATSVVKSWMIMSAVPTPIANSKAFGGSSTMPANQTNKAGGQIVNSTSEASWANNSTVSISARPDVFMPPEMFGQEAIYSGIDLTGSTSSAWSHQSLSKIDDSRDWRNRFFMCFWQAQVPGTTGHFAWDRGADTTRFIPTWSPTGAANLAMAQYQYFSFGQSFVQDSGNLPGSPPAGCSVVSFVGSTQLTILDSGTGVSSVALYVDQADGFLKVYINGTSATCLLFFWLFASRPYVNY